MRVHKKLLARAAQTIFVGALPHEWNKWKTHFCEIKGDVGMSVHEKEMEREDAHTKTQTHS